MWYNSPVPVSKKEIDFMKLRMLFATALLGVAMIANAAPQDKTPAKTSTTKSADAQKPPSPGMVWANEKSKVYHKEGDRWYGKTKNGKWMTEADAKKTGYH